MHTHKFLSLFVSFLHLFYALCSGSLHLSFKEIPQFPQTHTRVFSSLNIQGEGAFKYSVNIILYVCLNFGGTRLVLL